MGSVGTGTILKDGIFAIVPPHTVDQDGIGVGRGSLRTGGEMPRLIFRAGLMIPFGQFYGKFAIVRVHGFDPFSDNKATPEALRVLTGVVRVVPKGAALVEVETISVRSMGLDGALCDL